MSLPVELYAIIFFAFCCLQTSLTASQDLQNDKSDKNVTLNKNSNKKNIRDVSKCIKLNALEQHFQNFEKVLKDSLELIEIKFSLKVDKMQEEFQIKLNNEMLKTKLFMKELLESKWRNASNAESFASLNSKLENMETNISLENRLLYKTLNQSTIDVMESLENMNANLPSINYRIENMNEISTNISLDNRLLHQALNQSTADITKTLENMNEKLPSKNYTDLLVKSLAPRTCGKALQQHNNLSGIYKLNRIITGLKEFVVYCQQDSDEINRPWTVIQRRVDNTTDFYLGWNKYKYGFGNMEKNFWLGLEQIYSLTSEEPHELRIDMQGFVGCDFFVTYSHFEIDYESNQYKLKSLGIFNGIGEDRLKKHLDMKFSTYDNNNDISNKNPSCAEAFHGAWWYGACYTSNLNGEYIYEKELPKEKKGKAIIWDDFFTPLKYVQMMIRPRKK